MSLQVAGLEIGTIPQTQDVPGRQAMLHEDASWESPFYQYANRLAHLYYLNALNRQRAYLLFLHFAEAPDVPEPCTVAQWEGAERLTKKCLGLPKGHPFSDNVRTLIWSVPEMMAG
jgi:hypothetical protein